MSDALYDAAKIGDLIGVEAALAAGADVHANDDEALILVASRGHHEALQTLIDAGANVHAKDGQALSMAADIGCQDCAIRLLDAGAEVDVDSVVDELEDSGLYDDAQWLRRIAHRWLVSRVAGASSGETQSGQGLDASQQADLGL